MKVVQKTDLYVGLFVVTTIGLIVAALVATSGWGIRRFDLFMVTDNVQDVAIDTRIYLQGLEVGRIAAIEPRTLPTKRGQMEFVIRASMVAQFADKTELTLPCAVDAEVVSALLGGATLQLHVETGDDERPPQRCAQRAMLEPDRDTIRMHRRPALSEAFGGLATDLKSTLANAISAATNAVNAYRRLADSLSRTTSSARAFMDGIRPGTEATLNEASANLARVRRLLDTADVRSGATLTEFNLTLEQTRATMEQSRKLMASADSLTRLLASMGGENRPEIRGMIADARFLTQQLMYVMEQLSRRPMRAMSGVQLPDSLTAEGRARRERADSIARFHPSPDTSRSRRP